MPERIPVADGLFAETKDGARLIGSRCASCRTPYFPKVDHCRHPECGSSKIEDAGFGPQLFDVAAYLLTAGLGAGEWPRSPR